MDNICLSARLHSTDKDIAQAPDTNIIVPIYFNSCIHLLIDCDKTLEELLCGPTSCLWGNQPIIVNELSSLNTVRIFKNSPSISMYHNW